MAAARGNDSVPTGDSGALQTLLGGLRATPPARLPYQADVLVRSFVLERPAGNLVVYNSPGLSSAAPQIRELGGAGRLLVNHAHEAMYGPPRLEAPVWVHARDRAEVARSMPVAGTFSGPQLIDDDVRVVPTPGHTPGTTSYLWDSGEHRFLFTGDFVWVEHGEWKAVVLGSSRRADYLESLALVRELDFDVLVPWGVTERDDCCVLTDRGDIRARIDAITARVLAGADR